MSSNTVISLRPANVIRRLPWQVDSKAAMGFLLILAIFSLVGWLYLSQASAVTATSYRIDELRIELDHLKNENAALALEIAQLEALPRVESRAAELGYQPTTNVRYLQVSNYPVTWGDDLVVHSHFYGGEQPEAYKAEVGPSSRWLEALDRFAAWFEGR